LIDDAAGFTAILVVKSIVLVVLIVVRDMLCLLSSGDEISPADCCPCCDLDLTDL